MKIEKVSLLNIDDLYRAIVAKQFDKNHKDKKFGMKFTEFLSHMSIGFEISDINAYEYIFLKKYTNSVSKFKEDSEFNIDYIQSQFGNLYKSSIEPLFGLIKQLNESFPNKSVKKILPMALRTGSCELKLSGEGITLITGLEPFYFFLMFKHSLGIVETSGQENILHEEMVNMFDSEKFINYIIQTFVDGFYKFMFEKMIYTDLVSEAFNHSFYLDKFKYGATPFSVESFGTFINFSNLGQTEIIGILEMYKDDMIGKSEVDILKSITIEFGLKTDLNTYFTLFNNLPLEKIASTENFIRVMTYSESMVPVVPIFAVNNYAKRCISRISSLRDDINKNYSNRADYIKKFMMTFGYTEIKYTLRITLLDYMLYIAPLISEIHTMDNVTEDTLISIGQWCNAIKTKVTS